MGQPADLWDFGTIRRDLPGGGRGTVSRGVEPPLPPMPSVSSRASPSSHQPPPQQQQHAYAQPGQHQQYASSPAGPAQLSTSNRYGSIRSRNSGSLRAKNSSAYSNTASGFSDASTVKNGGTVGRSHAAYDTVRYTPEQTRDLRETDGEDREASGLAYDLSDEDERPASAASARMQPQPGSVDEPPVHEDADEEEEGDDEIDDSKAILDDVVVPVIESVRPSFAARPSLCHHPTDAPHLPLPADHPTRAQRRGPEGARDPARSLPERRAPVRHRLAPLSALPCRRHRTLTSLLACHPAGSRA